MEPGTIPHQTHHCNRKRTEKGDKDLNYEQRLRHINLPSLSYRRIRGDMIEVFKICHGIYDREVTEGLLCLERTTTRDDTVLTYSKESKTRNQKTLIFLYRIVDIWNSLPESVDESPSMKTFENHLDKHWKKLSIKY